MESQSKKKSWMKVKVLVCRIPTHKALRVLSDGPIIGYVQISKHQVWFTAQIKMHVKQMWHTFATLPPPVNVISLTSHPEQVHKKRIVSSSPSPFEFIHRYVWVMRGGVPRSLQQSREMENLFIMQESLRHLYWGIVACTVLLVYWVPHSSTRLTATAECDVRHSVRKSL